jgi:antitoxin HicB
LTITYLALACALQFNNGSRPFARWEIVVAANLSFSVILEPQEEGGFTVLVPSLPEVVTEGDTEQEALANAEEAIRAIVSYRRDHGIAIPADMAPEIRRVTVAA